jgi:hypothetical protein
MTVRPADAALPICGEVQVLDSSGWGDCDTCGSYSWRDVEVHFYGRMVWARRGDTHLGGPEPDEHLANDLVGVLTALGLKAEATFSCDD